jgi:hypothetical protein
MQYSIARMQAADGIVHDFIMARPSSRGYGALLDKTGVSTGSSIPISLRELALTVLSR